VKGPLDKLIREARDDLRGRDAPDVDWGAVEEKLFARIEDLKTAERARFRGARRAWVATAAAAAAAFAVVALVFGRAPERLPLTSSVAPHPGEAGEAVGSVAEIAPTGRVLVNGTPLGRGGSLAVGDTLEVQGADALIDSPGKVRLIVERGSRIRLTRRRGPLVVALERGAVEADVTPVESGEAFAVDVAHSRIAVHGTHFRVARVGARALVDLTEGVVSVGEAPRDGSLLGSVVTAPAHVEFAVSNAKETLAVDHDPTAVRPAASWGGAASRAELPPLLRRPATERAPEAAELRSAAAAKPAESRGATPPSTSDAAVSAAATTAVSSPLLSPLSPDEAVTSAVRACMAERPRADNVTVLFRTTLELDVAEDGAVRGARFDPPVLPDVNECAAPTIYRVRFPHGGAVTIPIDFKN
jgi:ferric-dicitrate binding protein FerR (iron transport regulator)